MRATAAATLPRSLRHGTTTDTLTLSAHTAFGSGRATTTDTRQLRHERQARRHPVHDVRHERNPDRQQDEAMRADDVEAGRLQQVAHVVLRRRPPRNSGVAADDDPGVRLAKRNQARDHLGEVDRVGEVVDDDVVESSWRTGYRGVALADVQDARAGLDDEAQQTANAVRAVVRIGPPPCEPSDTAHERSGAALDRTAPRLAPDR